MKYWDKYTKQELLDLPRRKCIAKSTYDSVLFVNTVHEHDSGYNLFAIIGVNNDIPVEIAGFMDDFRLEMFYTLDLRSLAFDCSMHGVFRMHADYHKIKVGHNTSTTMFTFE